MRCILINLRHKNNMPTKYIYRKLTCPEGTRTKPHVEWYEFPFQASQMMNCHISFSIRQEFTASRPDASEWLKIFMSDTDVLFLNMATRIKLFQPVLELLFSKFDSFSEICNLF